MTAEASADRPVQAGPTSAPQGVQHCALLYEDEQEFLAGSLPHLRKGIDAGDPTFAVTPRKDAEVLRDSLGRDASAVQFIDPSDFYSTPVRAMAGMIAVARSLGSRPAWVVASADWSKYPDAMEWVRYDSIFNMGFANADFRGYCCYNTAVLSPEVISLVRQTHPNLHEGARLRKNPDYRNPRDFVADVDSRPLPPSPHSAASMEVRPDDLHAVRAFVTEQAKHCHVAGDALYNLLVAVTEVATNAVRHGRAPVSLRAWPDNGLICEITDSGHWQPEEFLSWVPPESALKSGFGIWGVGMLCDTVQVRTGPQGTAVRLRVCRT
ncbi:anti-sigma factor RsbA family regulatory protein [Streptomyces sp. DSM 118148]|uniref:anti-sigma factor RsbA family regulatory protein n=1 Tax=Streptomyces sp. DSM 118148 TaxID=3448667 RepID=UPI00403FDF02